MRILIEDTGAGMSWERLKQIRAAMEKRGRGLGIGLGNIYRRITVYYHQGQVRIDSREHEGTSAVSSRPKMGGRLWSCLTGRRFRSRFWTLPCPG